MFQLQRTKITLYFVRLTNSMIYLFFIAFSLLMLLLNYYIYKRFLKKLTTPLSHFALVIPTLLTIFELLFLYESATHALIESEITYFVLSTSVGITFFLFVMALLYDFNITLFKRVSFNQSRRKFIKLTFDITMIIVAFSYLFRGIKNAIKEPYLNRVNISIENFSLDELSIIQLSDIHIGRTLKKEFVSSLVKRTNLQQPDIVVLTGDVVDMPIEYIKEDVAPLAELDAPTYFILGNHEYFHGAYETIEFMKSLGIEVLLNESATITKDDKEINLVGLTDLIGSRIGVLPIDVYSAFKNVNPLKSTIVLAHQPKTLKFLKEQEFDLMLSGHTHGGQIFPFGLLVMLDQPYLAGLYQHTKKKQIFVSRGSGYWGPPLRILAPSEISKIVIKRA